MADYQLTWITDSLAAGYAPMSYEELDSISRQGVSAIVNLCGEFSDLQDIEEKYGFDVFYLPLPDETAPDIETMERCIEWIDEALFLGKKVLVHCHHGIGRTGTVITAYLLKKGLGMKVAAMTLKLRNSRANPANYTQWSLLRKYGKKQGTLTIREPSLEVRNEVDLGRFFAEYEALVEDVESKWTESGNKDKRCGWGSDACCRKPFDLYLIECVYLIHHINKTLRNEERKLARKKAARASALVREGIKKVGSQHRLFAVTNTYMEENLICPLYDEQRCVLYNLRPLRCRYSGLSPGNFDIVMIRQVLDNISKELFLALSGSLPGDIKLEFPSLEAISGKFIERYFTIITHKKIRES